MKIAEEAVKKPSGRHVLASPKKAFRNASEYGHGHDAACEAIAAKIRVRKDAILPK
jgi:hypothetical protein